jgi:hypothetical protein
MFTLYWNKTINTFWINSAYITKLNLALLLGQPIIMLQANKKLGHVANKWKHYYAGCICKQKFKFWGRPQNLICSQFKEVTWVTHQTATPSATVEQQAWQKNRDSKKSSCADITFNEIFDHSAIFVFRCNFHKNSSCRHEPNFWVTY